jgi:cytochrome c oxidase cbb3-type subunit 3
MTMRRSERALWSIAVTASVFACNASPPDLREWKPTDHRHQTETAADNGRTPQVSGSAEPPMRGLEEVTIAAWRTTCATCHGQLGRGDGPQGPMVKARDLSDPAWQATVNDAQIAETMVKGRGRMPPSGLPPSTVEGLTHLVRLFNRDRVAAGAAAGAGQARSADGAPKNSKATGIASAAASAIKPPSPPKSADGKGNTQSSPSLASPSK